MIQNEYGIELNAKKNSSDSETNKFDHLRNNVDDDKSEIKFELK